MARILLLQGTQVVREIALEKSPFMIGRALESDLAVMDHLVSRKHAKIERDPASGCWRVLDLGSSNGIYVNDVRDRLRVGSAVIEFQGDQAPSPAGSFARITRAPGPQTGALSVTLATQAE